MKRRILVLFTIALAAFVTAQCAWAGTYQVTACDAAPGFVNNSWAATTNKAGKVTAETQCPSYSLADRGMMAYSNAIEGGSVSGGSVAQMMFRAPAGAAIVGIRYTASFYTSYSGWEAALSNGSQVFDGCSVGHDVPCVTNTTDRATLIPPSSALYIDAYCAYSSCPSTSSDASQHYRAAQSHLYSATVVILDDVPPTLGNVSGSLWTDAWRNGGQTVSFDATDNTGIGVAQMLVDGAAVHRTPHSCDWTQPAPCPMGGDSATIDTSGYSDGAHQLTVEADDSAGNPAQISRTIHVDNTPPEAPQGLVVDGGEGWRASNSFSLHWNNPPQNAAPIVGANWSLCPSSGDGTCQNGSADGSDLTSISAVKVPSAGDWTLSLWLRDAAGNANAAKSAGPWHLRFDDEAPSASIEPIDATNPTRLAVAVSDAISGVASGQIAIRRHGSDSWRLLPTSLQGGELVATLPDTQLADGTYDLQGHAVDAAGNERTTTAFTSGAPAEVKLPVRNVTRILGAYRAHTRNVRRSSVRVVRVGFGGRVTLSGRLVNRRGRGMARTRLLVACRIATRGAAWKLVAAITTRPSGRFAYRTAAGPSRVCNVGYLGTPTVRPASMATRIAVAARSTFHVAPHALHNGQRGHFAGRLLGRYVPRHGIQVQLQVYIGSHWQTFTTTQTDRRGRWHRAWRFKDVPSTVRYTFRALVAHQRNYPYHAGHSKRVSVLVRAP